MTPYGIEVGFDAIGSFAMLLARVGGLMIFAPFFGSLSISPRIRVLLAIAFSLALFPILEDVLPAVPSQPATLVLGLAGELLVGMTLGLVGQFFTAALQMAGQVAGFQMGFSLANVIDPQSDFESSVLSVFYNLVGLAVLLSLNAHHWFVLALVDSYRILEGTDLRLPPQAALHLVQVSGGLFTVGFLLAAPITLTILIVDFLMGIIGRAAPQIHILIMGMPSKALVGFLLLGATAQVLFPFLRGRLEHLHRELYAVLRLWGG